MCFELLFRAGWHANAGRLPEEVPRIHLFRYIPHSTLTNALALACTANHPPTCPLHAHKTISKPWPCPMPYNCALFPGSLLLIAFSKQQMYFPLQFLKFTKYFNSVYDFNEECYHDRFKITEWIYWKFWTWPKNSHQGTLALNLSENIINTTTTTNINMQIWLKLKK